MDLTHRFVVPAPVGATWAAFNDLERVARCFPGATVTSIAGDDFAGSVKVKLGPIAMHYDGTGTFVERDEAHHRAVIRATGQDQRGNGTAGVTVVAHMMPEGEGTAVELTSDLAITGRPSQFGRNVMQDVSDRLLAEFVDCMAGQLGGETTTPSGEPAVTEQLNLMSTVLPVMLRRYGLPVAGILVLAAIVWFVAR
jgi:carbon monoxide dehydrogenase subunit G